MRKIAEWVIHMLGGVTQDEAQEWRESAQKAGYNAGKAEKMAGWEKAVQDISEDAYASKKRYIDLIDQLGSVDGPLKEVNYWRDKYMMVMGEGELSFPKPYFKGEVFTDPYSFDPVVRVQWATHPLACAMRVESVMTYDQVEEVFWKQFHQHYVPMAYQEMKKVLAEVAEDLRKSR